MNVQLQKPPTARFLAQVRAKIKSTSIPADLGDLVAAQAPTMKAAEGLIAGMTALVDSGKNFSAETDEIHNLALDVLKQAKGDDQIGDKEYMANFAHGILLEYLAAKEAPISRPRSEFAVGHSWDQGDGLVARITDGLMSRLDSSHKPTVGQDFAHSSIVDVARAVLQANGQRPRIGGAASVVEMALHTTSDFPAILGDVSEKMVRSGYEAAVSGIKQVSREISAANFRDIHSIGVSNGPELQKVLQSGEFTRGTIEESDDKFKLSTYGKIFAISRQALVNDDLSVFSNMSPVMGRGAADTEAKLFAQLLEQNSGAGPTMGDGDTLFHANHNNLAGAGAAISETALSAATLALRRQTGLAGEVVNVNPAFLLVPPELETEVKKIVTAITPADSAKVNPFAGALTPLVDSYLSDATRWYVTGRPGVPDGLLHAYLDGQNGPRVTTREGFDVDGMEFKIRLDFGAGFVDFRSWYSNPGA